MAVETKALLSVETTPTNKGPVHHDDNNHSSNNDHIRVAHFSRSSFSRTAQNIETCFQRDVRGNVNVRQLRHKEKNVVHKETETFAFSTCRDLTRDVRSLFNTRVVRVSGRDPGNGTSDQDKTRLWGGYL